MDHSALSLLLLAALCARISPEPSPQYHPTGFHREHSPAHSDARPWAQSLRNYSVPAPNFDFLDPAASPVADEILKTNVPRQSSFYGAPNPLPFGYGGRNQNPFPPPPPGGQASGYPQGFPQGSSQGFAQGFPQIYKVDNLIIIANPPQQQACMPTSNVKPLDPNTFPGTDTDLGNRFGENEEPTKCTWAIVACCAPGSPSVRYNCFELMGCPGLFLDQNPCSPAIVEAATRAALAFYRNSSANTTATTGGDNNRL